MQAARRRPGQGSGGLAPRLARLALAALVALAALLGTARWWLLDAAPRVSAAPTPTGATLQPLQQWLRWNDPRWLRDGAAGSLRAGPADLQWLVEQAARLRGGAARLQLSDGRLDMQASLPLAGRWANLALTLGDGPRLPALQRLQLGPLALPGALAGPLASAALAVVDRPQDGRPPLHEMLHGVRFQDGEARLAYRWRTDLPQRLSDWLLPPAQQERIGVYQAALARALATPAVHQPADAGRGASTLPSLMQPLFALARERSADGEDPAAENRAALLVLAAHVGGRPLAGWIPAARAWPKAPRRPVLLGGRSDFAVHLVVSAALAAGGGGPLADALGLAKELGDARHGSGFSFNDFAINRAGTRLGELAVRDPARLQALLSEPVGAGSLLPDLSDLPEFLPETEFRQRFGGVGEPAYLAMTALIEARVAAMPLWH